MCPPYSIIITQYRGFDYPLCVTYSTGPVVGSQRLASSIADLTADRFSLLLSSRASEEGEVMSLIPDSTNSLDWSVGEIAMV